MLFDLKDIVFFAGAIVTISGAAAAIYAGLGKLIKAHLRKLESWTKKQQGDIDAMQEMCQYLVKTVRAVIKIAGDGAVYPDVHRLLEELDNFILSLSMRGKSYYE